MANERTIRILHVDDAEDWPGLIGALLAKKLPGTEYVSINSVREALLALRHAKEAGKPFDVVISDVALHSGSSGFEFLKTAMEEHGVPGILLTGMDARKDEFSGVRVFSKGDFKIDQLKEHILRLADEKPAKSMNPADWRNERVQARIREHLVAGGKKEPGITRTQAWTRSERRIQEIREQMSGLLTQREIEHLKRERDLHERYRRPYRVPRY